MREAGEKDAEPVEPAAAQRDNARSFAIQPQAAEERRKSQNENTDRKRQGYLRDAPSELLRERRAENAPGIDCTQRDLETHSRHRDYPAITRSHGFATSA